MSYRRFARRLLVVACIAAPLWACADSNRGGFVDADASTPIGGPGGDGGLGGPGGDSGFAGCGTATFQAKALPAAMMFVLDKSGTMADGGKYAAAQAAIAQAIDVDAFDSMHIGLLGYPTGNVPSPACLGGVPGLIQVLCGVSGLPATARLASDSMRGSDTVLGTRVVCPSAYAL